MYIGCWDSSDNWTLHQGCFNVGPLSATLAQNWTNIVSLWETLVYCRANFEAEDTTGYTGVGKKNVRCIGDISAVG